MVEEINQLNFKKKVIKSDKPVVLKVWGSKCHNCKTLTPIFDDVSADNQDNAFFFGLKADDNMELVRSLKIKGVPTLLFYHHGVLIAKKIGVRSQNSISSILEPILTLSPAEAEENKYRTWWNRLTKRNN